MVLINLVKISTLKVKGKIYYLISKYTNKTLGQMPTVMVTGGNRWEEPLHLRVTPGRVTAMEIPANEMKTTGRMI